MTKLTLNNPEEYTFPVLENDKDLRIDQYIAKKLPNYSRTFIQKLIESQHLTVNKKTIIKSSYPVQPGDIVHIVIPNLQIPRAASKEQLPTNIPIIFQNNQFLIVCKPPGLAVHPPKPTFKEATLSDWLTEHFSELRSVGLADRPGIVHRLDKDTSGILIIPRTNYAHKIFSNLFKERKIIKKYLAIVEGQPPKAGIIDFLILRHPQHRNKMTHSSTQGREACTHYEVVWYFENASLVEVQPITGRTHQIRVHMAAIGHPIVGDLLYGTKSPYIKRQALHAREISFSFENENYDFFCEIPEDMQKLIMHLKSVKFQA